MSRSRRENQLCRIGPRYATDRHYLSTMEENFQKAAKGVVQQSVPHTVAQGVTPSPEDKAESALQPVTTARDSVQQGSIRPGRIRTCGLRFRKAPLYPTELRGRTVLRASIVGCHSGSDLHDVGHRRRWLRHVTRVQVSTEPVCAKDVGRSTGHKSLTRARP